MKCIGCKAALAIAAVGLSLMSWSQNAPTNPKTTATGSDRLMSREELKACIELQDRIKKNADLLQADKAAMDSEKAGFEKTKADLQALRGEVEKHLAAFKAADRDVANHAKTIEDWNAEVKAAEESTMTSAKRRRQQLLKEQPELVSKNNQLLKLRDEKYARYEKAVADFNTSGKSLEASVVSWNKRNEKLADESEELLDARAEYASTCARRRFLEEDEAAIRAKQ